MDDRIGYAHHSWHTGYGDVVDPRWSYQLVEPRAVGLAIQLHRARGLAEPAPAELVRRTPAEQGSLRPDCGTADVGSDSLSGHREDGRWHWCRGPHLADVQ